MSGQAGEGGRAADRTSVAEGRPEAPGRDGTAGGRPDEPGRVPIISMILMGIFLAGGSIGLLVDWPAGPYNLDWGVWVVLYGGYGYVIGAAIFHARTGR